MEKISSPLVIHMMDDKGSFVGYASVFNRVDSHRDTVAYGAFRRTLREWNDKGMMPKLLWQHDSAQPIGRIARLYEDAYGLRIEGVLCMETWRGREAYALLKQKAIEGLSIGFTTKKAVVNTRTRIRTLVDIDLFEVSLVTFACNEAAKVTDVKSASYAAPSKWMHWLKKAPARFSFPKKRKVWIDPVLRGPNSFSFV